MSKPGPSNACTFSSPKKKRSKKCPMNALGKVSVTNVLKHLEEMCSYIIQRYSIYNIQKQQAIMLLYIENSTLN